MRRGLALLLSVLVVLVALYGGVSWCVASQGTKAERKPLEDTIARLELPYEDVVFPARDKGATLDG